MGGFATRITKVERCGEDTLLFEVAKPEGYVFSAGQWARVGLQTPDGEQVRTLSHATAPSDPALGFATRLSSSAFKVALGAARAGTPVSMVGPGGRLRLGADDSAPVFLAGGVGITPIRSIIRDAWTSGLFRDALLFYGNRDPECVPYGDELRALRGEHFGLVEVFERGARAEELSGTISAGIIRSHVEHPSQRQYYVAGPPGMVTAMSSVLDELGVDPANRHVESFR